MVRKIKAKLVLRLRAEGFTGRQIAAQGMSRTSVAAVIDAADREGIGWDDVAKLEEADVYARLFPGRGEHDSVHAQPDWDRVHRELARVGVTLKLLHGEYVDACRAAGSTAMGYDRFCKAYQQHVLISGAASRVGHKAGQTVEVDWSGKTMQLTDPVTGQQTRVYLFVATLPFSRYSFVEPTLDMQQDAWLRAHVSMFDWFGGSVPRVVPDNLKTGVLKHPAEGEVVLNDAYRELAAHYSAAVLPGRVKKPKDKASVENTVGNVATWVIASLRDRSFASLAELRAVVYERVAAYNAEPFQKRAGSRLSVFDSEEKPLLRPLPVVPFEISRWFYRRRVQKNGHVVFERNFYSVPYPNIGRSVDLRVTDTTVEIFAGQERLTSHLLAPVGMVNEYRTHDSDLPDGPRYRQWDAERVREWAGRIGEDTTIVVNRIFESVPVDEQGLDAALAVLRLTRRYSAARVEAAAGIALASRVRSPRYAHLRPILETNQDQPDGRSPWAEPATTGPTGYVRGADYYAGDIR
ncbi:MULTISPECIES: IS21 family transposase [Microbacterium]|jgi:transposase|uniref:Transposase n=5 Tax=Microbacterium TaxID=33882 RepID=A0AA40VKX9_9MICO|nr:MULTISPECIES: IS21 family transposase [Microbacterium]MBB4138899.1 transposase [Microbacterium invictum]MBB4140030.1 transposase [Microbacterium invictum]MBB4140319.1 transposase [Microbacterium invictum]MBB4141074.1 transposase [Microbacterium invictum]WOQ69125.1 IS21 family transposase [Microbacterium sp. Y20]